MAVSVSLFVDRPSNIFDMFVTYSIEVENDSETS